MKLIFNESSFRRFNTLAMPLAIVWCISTFGGAFLSKIPVQGYADHFKPFFELLHLGDKFSLSGYVEGTTQGKTVTTTMLVPSPHRIKAIYRSNDGSFVSISNGAETQIVALNGTYEKEFKLIGLSDSAAIFKGFGKTYRLILGHEGSLDHQESVVQSVADPSRGNEWRSISRTIIIDQMRNLQVLFKSVEINEVRSGDKINGFRVERVAPESILGRFGVIQGDVIESVNNKKLESYSDVFSIYNQIPHMHSIRITVNRNNLQKDIIYEITP
jgi:type II secretion system protein C